MAIRSVSDLGDGIGVIEVLKPDRRERERRHSDRRAQNRRQPERRANWPGPDKYDYEAEDKVHGRRQKGSDKRVCETNRRQHQTRIADRRQRGEQRTERRRKLARRASDRIENRDARIYAEISAMKSASQRRPITPEGTAEARLNMPKPEPKVKKSGLKFEPASKIPAAPIGKKAKDDNFKSVPDRIRERWSKFRRSCSEFWKKVRKLVNPEEEKST